MTLFGADRKKLKAARELVAHTDKMIRIQRDVLDAQRLKELESARDNLREALAGNRVEAINPLREKLEKIYEKCFPRPDDAGVRENVDVLLVAIIVAMAVRTFFVQPFKIPTGSMYPTLYGITEEQDCQRNVPLTKRWVDIVKNGQWPGNQRASLIEGLFNFAGWSFFGKWPAAGRCYQRGDHIFVDRLTYHFRKPKHGEVIVFETDDIPEIPESSRGKFYIKRLIGLSGDSIQLDPPYVRVNGEVLNSRPAFERIYSMQNGYNGYVIPEDFPHAKYLHSRSDIYMVPTASLFVLGDNSRSSLDGRFWGSVPRKALVGRAVLVYWPFSSRFGLVD